MAEEGLEGSKMKPEHEEAIKTHLYGITTIEPRTVTPYLFDDGEISFKEKETIEKVRTRQGRANKLVEIVLNGGPTSFDAFVRSLNKAGHHNLASKLKSTAENIKNKTLQHSPRQKLPIVSLVEGPFDKKDGFVSPREAPPVLLDKRRKSLKPTTEVNLPKKPDIEPVQLSAKPEASEPPEEEVSNQTDVSQDIYETLKIAHQQMKSQVDPFLALFEKADENGTVNIRGDLESRMQKVEDENARLKMSSHKDKKTFSRDMILLIVNMNDVLTFMKDALLDFAGNLEKNEVKYKQTIKNMKIEINKLKDELEVKRDQLFELKRDHEVNGFCYQNNVKKVIAALNDATKLQQKYFEERDKREQEARRRQARIREQERLEKEKERKEKQMDRKQRDLEMKEIERLKQELEALKRTNERNTNSSQTQAENGQLYTVALGTMVSPTPRSTTKEVFMQTGVPKLPVLGRQVARTPRDRRK